MNFQDYEQIKEQRKERRKEMDRVRDHLMSQMGFNSSDSRIQVRENNIGQDTLFVAPGVDLTNLPDGWKYEANYNLDGATKEVIYRMKDGKYEYIPIGHDANKSQVIRYSSPEDVVDAILAENRHIDKSQVYYDRNSRVIKLVGVVNDIRMPAGLEMRDGKIVDINDYGKEYEVSKSLASDITNADMMSGTGMANDSGVKSNVQQNPYHDDILSKYVTPNAQGATIEQYGKSLFDFAEMKRVQENYFKNDSNEAVSRTKDGSYRSFDNTSDVDPKVEATLELNEIWIQSFSAVTGSQGNERSKESSADMAFNGENTQSFFMGVMQKIQSSPSRKFSDIMMSICNDPEFMNKIGAIKVMACFISNPQVAKCLEIEGIDKATPDKVMNAVDEYANQLLKEHAEDMLNDLDPVMEKTMPKPHY